MAYCADNGDQGTIDPMKPNKAVNTTGEISQYLVVLALQVNLLMRTILMSK